MTGWFEGTDVNHDGQIVFWLGEVTGFSITFSGNALVPAFQLGLFDLNALNYDVGTPLIGDSSGAKLYTEGISAVQRLPVPDGYRYDTGYLPAYSGGAVISGPQGVLESTAQLLAVSSVPEPAGHWLWAAGALLLVCRSGPSRRLSARRLAARSSRGWR